jgi:hypothetical protein
LERFLPTHPVLRKIAHVHIVLRVHEDRTGDSLHGVGRATLRGRRSAVVLRAAHGLGGFDVIGGPVLASLR